MTPRGTHLTLEKSIERINSWYIGWSGYFAMTYYPAQLQNIEAHIRRRLRSRLVDQQKSKRNLYRKLTERGVSLRQAARAVFSNKARWALSNTFAVTRAYPVGWFIGEMGQAIRSTESYRPGLTRVSGYALREEPCTDPYARFWVAADKAIV